MLLRLGKLLAWLTPFLVGAAMLYLGREFATHTEVRAAVQINSEITARAVKGALKSKLSAMKALQFGPDEAPLRLKGYRITRKIGVGGMTQVYLAVREGDGLPVVLKVHLPTVFQTTPRSVTTP